MTTTLSLSLELGLVLLLCSALIEVGLISTTLGWLRTTASAGFHFYDGASANSALYTLSGEPANFLLTQTYVALADAGSVVLLVGAGGFLALWARRAHLRLYHRHSYHLRQTATGRAKYLLRAYYAWAALQLPLLLFTAAALGYVLNVTAARQGQAVRLDAAVRASANATTTMQPGGTTTVAGVALYPYPLDSWTPQSWLAAVLALDLVESRGDVRAALNIMDGWLWNLCPMLALQVGVVILAYLELVQWRRAQVMDTNQSIKRLSRL